MTNPTDRYCRDCETPLAPPTRPGRPPVRCPACLAARAREKAARADARATRLEGVAARTPRRFTPEQIDAAVRRLRNDSGRPTLLDIVFGPARPATDLAAEGSEFIPVKLTGTGRQPAFTGDPVWLSGGVPGAHLEFARRYDLWSEELKRAIWGDAA